MVGRMVHRGVAILWYISMLRQKVGSCDLLNQSLALIDLVLIEHIVDRARD